MCIVVTNKVWRATVAILQFGQLKSWSYFIVLLDACFLLNYSLHVLVTVILISLF